MYTRIKSFSKENVDFIENQVKEKGKLFVQLWGPKATGNFRDALAQKGIVEDFCQGACKNYVYVRYVRR